ncbi:fam-c protein [Plasmodium vinckei vinckei]|uniref:Fam-c protein n=1 Tax=Plasmodium vinckei vinckei TaxID=54757 RepID=A0A081I955_PLAVN|nr:fam-c protein [Plasmodium vinckei vinckei]KEG00213.1 hypothetical protein YYE_04940 [Plasmodium vinckei vinckei]VEV55128.1 fam-c protein [Plasmodium vinckei vinckei]
MNKRIFSLVCIILYVLLTVSIHCSEQKSDRSKAFAVGNKRVRGTKEKNKRNEKNDIELQRENQSNNNSNKSNNHEIVDSITYYRKFKGKLRKRESYCCGLFYLEGDDLY